MAAYQNPRVNRERDDNSDAPTLPSVTRPAVYDIDSPAICRLISGAAPADSPDGAGAGGRI